MATQKVFKRYELKYVLTREQKERLVSLMESYMTPDKYGRTNIRNIYFDTPDYRLIRNSIEKPVFKEKLRIRSYGKAAADSPVYVELKRKCDHVVYKRRVEMSEQEAMRWICGGGYVAGRSDYGRKQISGEIDYFLGYYGNLAPAAFISYDRQAYYAKDDKDFRVTFDENILCRQTDLSLKSEAYGMPVLEGDKILMEIKCAGGMPMWMVKFLSEEHIYKTSFSKYGTAYRKYIWPGTQEVAIYA